MGSEGGRERESGRTCVIESRGGSKRGNGERTTAAEEAEHYLTSALRPSFAVRDDGIAAKQREELHGSGPAVRSMQQRRGKKPDSAVSQPCTAATCRARAPGSLKSTIMRVLETSISDLLSLAEVLAIGVLS